MTATCNCKLSEVCIQDRRSIKLGQLSGLRYVGLESIESNTGVFIDGVLSKTPEAPKANSFHFTDKHVLYGKLRPYLNKVALPEFAGKCSTEIIPLLPGDNLNREYLAYFLRSSQTVSQISEKTTGARMPRADMHFVLSLEIPLPSLADQQSIVNILKRADNIRRLRKQAQDTARQLIPALFIDMFGDPATNPKGWQITRMGDIFSSTPNYGTMIKPAPDRGLWLDIRVANIKNGQLDLTDKKWVDLPENALEKHTLQDGDLILARAIGSLSHLGKCVIVYPGSEKWAFDSHLMRVRFDRTRVVPEYVTTLLHTPGGRGLFLRRTRSSAVQFNINTKEFSSLEIPLPPIEFQNNFMTRLDNIHSIMNQQEKGQISAESTFQSLLYSAFTEKL